MLIWAGLAVWLMGAGQGLCESEYRAESFRLERKDGSSREYRYLVLEPLEREEGKTYPVVLFLHGAGERGDDPRLLEKHFLDRIVESPVRERFPCYVIAPQCPKDDMWSRTIWSNRESSEQAKEPTEALAAAWAIFQKEIERLPAVDPSRLYLTGLSMGGFGSWELAARHPETFAAVVPICGGGDERQAERLINVPIWAFHGAKDEVVPVERTRSMIAAIRKAGGEPLYTEFPEEGHSSWKPAYQDPDRAIGWMFAQKRGTPMKKPANKVGGDH
ncbi:MAG: prolyl oligopeptidase family serine peptidase [Planctomycetota bacterium]